jgi:hypothetical protein
MERLVRPYPNRYPSHMIDEIIPFMKFIHLMISGSGMFIPDPGSEFFQSRIRIKEFKHFNPKVVSKLSEI